MDSCSLELCRAITFYNCYWVIIVATKWFHACVRVYECACTTYRPNELNHVVFREIMNCFTSAQHWQKWTVAERLLPQSHCLPLCRRRCEALPQWVPKSTQLETGVNLLQPLSVSRCRAVWLCCLVAALRQRRITRCTDRTFQWKQHRLLPLKWTLSPCETYVLTGS